MSDSSSKLRDLPREERLLLMRFVCSFAWADHRVQPQETALIARFVRRLDLDGAEVRQVEAWLEEPPARTYIFLVTSRVERLLPTIRSRCQQVRFGPLDDEAMAAWFAQSPLGAGDAALDAEVDEEVNQRRLTNVGTFRAYAYNYLKNHPQIHDGMTLLVRQLSPGPEGLPIEIYCFTNTTVWGDYEGIQADVFDHLLAIVPEFGLRLYQKPAGSDFGTLKEELRAR